MSSVQDPPEKGLNTNMSSARERHPGLTLRAHEAMPLMYQMHLLTVESKCKGWSPRKASMWVESSLSAAAWAQGAGRGSLELEQSLRQFVPFDPGIQCGKDPERGKKVIYEKIPKTAQILISKTKQ